MSDSKVMKRGILGLLGIAALVGLSVLLRSQPPAPIATPISSPSLSPAVLEVRDVEQQLIQKVREEDPRIALQGLQKAMDEDEGILNACHEIVHNIGQESYRKYQDIGQVLSYQDPMCTSGYIHGVMEAYFVEGGSDVLQRITSICSSYPEDRFLRWQCVHGVGHGLMYYSSNDVEKATKSCSTFISSFDQSACHNGVYMENFNADMVLHPSRFLKPEDPMYPCRLTTQFKHDCYMNAPVYFLREHARQYNEALTWCQQSEKAWQDSCYYGVAAQIIRRNIDNPAEVFPVCENVPASSKQMCIGGAVTMYMSHFASAEAGIKLCALAPTVDQALCLDLVNQTKGIFDQG